MRRDQLPKVIKLLNWGVNESPTGPVVINDTTLQVLPSNQKKLRRTRIALDYEHNTVPGSEEYLRTQEPRPIAAMCTPELRPGDGLYLTQLDYTPIGEQTASLYEDVSAAVLVDADNTVLAIHSAALTRTGAIESAKSLTAPPADLQRVGAARILTLSAAWPALLTAPAAGKPGGHKSPPAGYPEDADLYADPNNYKYPIDTPERVRAAWSYIHMPRNQEPYTQEELEYIMDRIRKAAKKFGIDIETETKKTTLSMEELLELKTEIGQIRSTVEAINPAAIDARLKELSAQIETITQKLAASESVVAEAERRSLVIEATRQGKVIPLSDDAIKRVPLDILREIVQRLEPTVPLGKTGGKPGHTTQSVSTDAVSALRLSVEGVAEKHKLTRADALRRVIAEQPEIYRAYIESGAGTIWTSN